MPGIFGAVGAGIQEIDPVAIGGALDPAGIAAPVVWTENNAIISHSSFAESPVKGVCYAEQGYRGWFSGDLPGRRSVPWEQILSGLLDGKYSRLKELNGQFAVALIEEKSGRTWLVSDRRSQQPLHYAIDGRLFVFSTVVSAFCRLPHSPAISPEWLYEVLYFNHPVLDTTFLRDVKRSPPASVISWDPVDSRLEIATYAPPFTRPDRLIEGREGLEFAQDVFSRATIDCFDTPAPTAVALTAGFDSRSVLAYAPPPADTDLLAYTYGIPGNYDLAEAASLARRFGIEHKEILFDRDNLSQLPEKIYETIRYSDGRERILRSTLLNVFETLHKLGRAVAVTGVSGDHLFRDHLHGVGNVPALISADLMRFIHKGEENFTSPIYREAFDSRHDAFVAHLRKIFKAMYERHGNIRKPEGYLRYLVYENAPRHFGGEAALAGTLLTYRTPYWDNRVLSMVFSIAQSTLGLSERLPDKDRFIECGLQGYLVRRSPHYARAPIKGASAAAYERGNKLLYQLERLVRRGPGRLIRFGRKQALPPLENWEDWLTTVLADEIRCLLGPECRLRTYIEPQALSTALNSGNLQWLGKLVTAEIVLRLVENGWQKITPLAGS